MYEEAAKISLFGLDIYAYGLYVALGACAACALLALLTRQEKLPKGTAALAGALMLPCGFILSRLLYCVIDARVRDALSLRALLLVGGGGYSMFGALLGAALGAALAARIMKVKSLKLLDLLAPALMLFVAFERLGESVLELPFGVSRPLTDETIQSSILAVQGDYESYLRTYLLESFAAFVLAVALLVCRRNYKRPGSALLLALMLFGATQTIFESLRFDAHMRVSFIGAQQVFAMAALLGAAGYLAAKSPRNALSVAAWIALPLSLAAGVGLEFLIDRSGISKLLLYALFVFDVALPVWLGIRLLDRRDSLGEIAG